MSVTVVTSGGNLNVTTSQKTLVGTPGTFENSDASYSVSVASGGTTVGPDITLTKNDDTTVSAISNIDLDLGVIDPFPATWDEFVAEYGRGYEYPQPTDQGVSYRTGDDKDIEDTIFGATNRNAQTLKARNTLASFLVLNNNNSFGNTNRFTALDGTQTISADYIIDHYTGMGWSRALNTTQPWNPHIDGGLASTANGFSDWFLPNITQLISIGKEGQSDALAYNYAPFNIPSIHFSVSTTRLENTANHYEIRNLSWIMIGTILKTDGGNQSIYCRKHF